MLPLAIEGMTFADIQRMLPDLRVERFAALAQYNGHQADGSAASALPIGSEFGGVHVERFESPPRSDWSLAIELCFGQRY